MHFLFGILLSALCFSKGKRVDPINVEISKQLLECGNSIQKSIVKKCPLKKNYDDLSVGYMSEFDKNLTKFKMNMVKFPRKQASFLIAREALSLEGDFVETGVFTGGTAAILMKVISDFDTCGRKFYAFDSFLGLPHPLHEDEGDLAYSGKRGRFAVNQSFFENNLKSVGVWNDDVIRVTKGWFNETCAKSPVQKISFLRLDGDMFSSTWDAISAFYERVVPGGFIYVDDFA
jgi:hypothetical protein